MRFRKKRHGWAGVFEAGLMAGVFVTPIKYLTLERTKPLQAALYLSEEAFRHFLIYHYITGNHRNITKLLLQYENLFEL